MNRKNTNFPSEVSTFLTEAYDSSKYKDTLKYYQILSSEYFRTGASKGLFLWHHMGLGKTLLTYHIIYVDMETKSRYKKYVVIAPRALQENFKSSSNIYTNITGKQVDMEKVYFVKLSRTTEKQIAIETREVDDPFNMDKKSKNITTRLNSLNGYTIIIEEGHLFFRRLAHGSEPTIRLYELIMKSDCKIIILSGSLIASTPFEIAPITNILSGERVLPENEEVFNELFYDEENNIIKNRAILQNRSFGLFSRMKPDYLGKTNEELFPKRLDTQIIKIPMTGNQLQEYIVIREEEIKTVENSGFSNKRSNRVDNFKSSNVKSGSYRIRSRQYSNFTPNAEIGQLYKHKSYTQSQLIQIIDKLEDKDIHIKSNKSEELIKIIKSRKNQKGIIYSQFIGVGGAANISRRFKVEKYVEVKNQDLKSIKSDSNIIRYALVNGNLTEEEQSNIVNFYNSETNNHGEKLKLLIIGFEQCMGLDLKATRFTIMFEPYWVYYLADQLEYRANRYKSHIMLPKEEQNVQMYIFLSTYPEKFNKKNLSDQMQKTTDEHIYNSMLANQKLLDSFKSAIEEVSIECDLLTKFNKNVKQQCRKCIPDNKPLYTSSNKRTVISEAIKYDIKNTDPCKTGEKTKVKAEKITITIDGNKTDYYYIKSNSNLYGYRIFIKIGENYEEIPQRSQVFKTVIEKLMNK